MTRILICDNNPIFLEHLKKEVEAILPAPVQLVLCHSSAELRQEAQNSSFDIALMDIHLGQNSENGISLAQELFPSSCGTAVIFITGYVEYVSDVYDADHVYFLRKPVSRDYLEKALNKALEFHRSPASTFPVHINGTTTLIDLREVLCIESFYRKLRFRLWNETLECYGSISSLPEFVRKQMIQCHKSFLVNPDYIRTLDRQKFLLKDGTTVPISRTRYNDSRQLFLDYCARNLKL